MRDGRLIAGRAGPALLNDLPPAVFRHAVVAERPRSTIP